METREYICRADTHDTSSRDLLLLMCVYIYRRPQMSIPASCRRRRHILNTIYTAKVALYRLRFAGPPADNRIQLRNPRALRVSSSVVREDDGERTKRRRGIRDFRQTSGRMRRMRGAGGEWRGGGGPTRKTREKNKREGATGEEGGRAAGVDDVGTERKGGEGRGREACFLGR